MSSNRFQGRMNTHIIFWIIMLAAIVGACFIIWPFVPTILWAAVFSILLYPIYKNLTQVKKWKEVTAALAVTMIPALLLIVPAIVLATVAGAQVYDYAQLIFSSAKTEGAEGIIRDVAKDLNSIVKPILTSVGVTNFDLVQVVTENREQITKGLSGPLANGIKSFVITMVTLVLAVMTTFFMIKDSHFLLEPVTELVPLPRAKTIEILERMAMTVRSVFFAVIVVAIIQGTLCGIGYAIAGVSSWAVWMLLTCALAAIPLLGAPVVYIPICISLIIQGKVVPALILLGFCIGVSQIDNFLRPYFISGGAKLHAIPVFFALLGGVLVLGPVGLMAGPMLLTLILAFVDVLRVRRELEIKGELDESLA